MTHPWLAPTEYWTLPPELKRSIVNGCGPGNWKLDLVPDNLLGIEIEEPCNIHDFEYWQNIDKDVADARLLANIMIAIKKHHPTSLIGEIADRALFLVRIREALTYYIAVSIGGQSAWDSCKRVIQ